MKILFLIILFSFSPLRAFDEIEALDRAQEILGQKFIELNIKYPSLIDVNKAVVHGDRETVETFYKDIKSYFDVYDQFNLKKIDYFFEYSLIRARAEAADQVRENGKLSKKAKFWLKKMEDIYRSYLDSKIYFGTERDLERLDIGQQMLPAYGEFASAILKSRGKKAWRKYGSGKIVPFVDNLPDAFNTSGQFLRLLWASYFRANTGKQDSAPIPEALGATQRKLVKLRKIDTSWEGLENIENLDHDGKTLNMFLINHANSFYDTSAQQAFPVKGISSIGNVDIFFPPFLAKRMVKSDHVITVGHGDTTQKTVDLVRRKQLNKFFLAIEGITGVGLYEMRPVMPLFNSSVYDSIKRGLNLKLYPVAFPDNFRLMNDWRSPIEGLKKARGIVLPPLSNEVCLGLKEMTQSEDGIGQFIRWNWFSTLNNSNEEVLSMPYPSEILKRLERMIWGME
jgi:hypothetical protein